MFKFSGDAGPYLEASFLVDRLRTQLDRRLFIAHGGAGSGSAEQIASFLGPDDSLQIFSTAKELADRAFREIKGGRSLAVYDLAYIGDCGSFAETLAAAALVKGMIKVGGYLLVDSEQSIIDALIVDTDADFKRIYPIKGSSTVYVYQMAAKF